MTTALMVIHALITIFKVFALAAEKQRLLTNEKVLFTFTAPNISLYSWMRTPTLILYAIGLVCVISLEIILEGLAFLHSLPALKERITNSIYYIPTAYVTGNDLEDWYQANESFSNYTCCDHRVIFSQNVFVGEIASQNSNLSGQVITTLYAYGNHSKYMGGEGSTVCKIQISQSQITSVSFERNLEWVNPNDVQNFVIAWGKFKALPFLDNHIDERDTRLSFTGLNITEESLRDWTGHQYLNYTNYHIKLYEIYSEFIPRTNFRGPYHDVYGFLTFSFDAYGNHTTCNHKYWCPKIKIHSQQATIWMEGINTPSLPTEIYVDYNSKINYSDIQNFLQGYYMGIVAPKVKKFYKI